MTRLILVNRYFFPDESATAQFATDLARHLAGRYEVIALTSRQRIEEPAAHLAAHDTQDGVRIRRLWSTRFGRRTLAGRALDYASFLLSALLWLLLHSRRGDIVLAKTDPPLLGVATTLATFGRGVRRVQWLQDLYPETAVALGVAAANGWATRATRALRDWSLDHSHLAVTVSAGMLEIIGGRAAQSAHIPNWSDDFGADGARSQDSAELTVGYSGNLGRAHPIDSLLELAAGAPEPGFRFVITGGGANYERLRGHIERLGRREWTFLPYQPRARLGEVLRVPDLHLVILEPRAERYIFPSKLYGILAAGRPVLHLGDPRGELACLLRDLACGWSVAHDSGDALRERLGELRGKPQQLYVAGRRARAAFEKHFSQGRAFERWDRSLDALRARETV